MSFPDHQASSLASQESTPSAIGLEPAVVSNNEIPHASPVDAQSRWSGLYSDALYSIFKFASLQDLTRLMRVSRRWGEAVMTMPPIAAPAFIPKPAHFDRLLASRVCRHITSLCRRGAWESHPYGLSTVQLQRASVQVPWLCEVTATVPISTVVVQTLRTALPRFPNLRRLDLDLHRSMPVESSNRIIETIGGLNPATMQHLTLRLPPLDQLSFAPLSALTQLQFFSFTSREPIQLSDAQICELRAVKQLNSPYRGDAETNFLTRMLQPGHALQWTTIGPCGGLHIEVTEPLAAVLGSLPTLTSLKAGIRCADVQFLAQLSQLTDVELDGWDSAMDPAALVSSLRCSTGLTRLRLQHVNLSSVHMEVLLPTFPLLSELDLVSFHHLDSLRCFATPALAASLTSLSLTWLRRCPPSELSQLFGLRSLRTVSIRDLAQPLADADAAAFRVPSARFPALNSSALS